MCKDLWLLAYEQSIEELAEEHDICYDEAEKLLLKKLDKDPGYLEGYHSDLWSCYA